MTTPKPARQDPPRRSPPVFKGGDRRIVLTRFHEDHVGGASELGALTGAEVLAHPLDTPVVRGEVPGQPPMF
ncbi:MULTISPECIES: MBL fold metallo-hydrolase [Streptomyces]|uniref:Uncharacterized protein n=1 Tax=Streptomyces doebereineriae TaxID=3075528 RepID=A0ABU2VL47_9ACTN|nr:hypothetical protein [Streptomyces sp. DSM 41640]MDT0486089.1 hypothetical protein [Streptomyces sp. DSM 41640]